MDAILAIACSGILALYYAIAERSLWFGIKVGAWSLCLMFVFAAVGL